MVEFANGGNLQELLVSQGGTLPEHHVRKIVSEIASGLFYLYESEIVHGNIKMENIMINFPRRRPD